MNSDIFRSQDAPSFDESEIYTLYRQILDGWNQHSAEAFASPFAEDGEVIGFDGSQMIGQTEIASTLEQIFVNHVTEGMRAMNGVPTPLNHISTQKQKHSIGE